jgi:hypothetical protein
LHFVRAGAWAKTQKKIERLRNATPGGAEAGVSGPSDTGINKYFARAEGSAHLLQLEKKFTKLHAPMIRKKRG